MNNKQTHKKQIVLVTVTLGNGGAERVLSIVANRLFQRGYDVTLIQTKPISDIPNYNLDKGIKVTNFKNNGKNNVFRYIYEIRMLRKELRKYYNPTIIAFLSQSIFVSNFASLGLKCKVIVSERSDPRVYPAKRIQRFFRNLSFRMTDICVFQVEDVKNMFPKAVAEKSIIIPNPVNPNLPEPYNGEREKRIVAACRLHYQKNLGMLISAFSELLKKHPDYTLDIYGIGDEEERLKKTSVELGVADKVIFHGFEEDVPNKILKASMFVCSSNYEGISNSLLEAMAIGLPVISTDCPVGGSRFLIKNNYNGVLIKVGDKQGLISAMDRIICDTAFSNFIMNNSIAVRHNYSIETIGEMWENIV